MSKRLEYHIHYANDDFEIVAPSKWRFAKKLAKQCIEGTRKDIHRISRVEFSYSDDIDHAWLDDIEYTDLFYYEEDN